MERLTSGFAQVLDVRETARLVFEPVRSGVISWNTYATAGTLAFRLLRAHAPATDWLDYAEWHPAGSKTFSPDHQGVHVDVDLIRADQPFDGIDVRARGVDFNLVAFSSPRRVAPSLPYARSACILDVPPRSQFVKEGERGWCSPASLSMILAFHGIDVSVEQAARAAFDRAYNGTGNWSFNVAFAGSLGLRGVVGHLRNLDHAQRLIERNLPIAISYSWSDGELPGAPLEHSDGHLAVLCGFTGTGDCAMNDPAAPNVRVAYPRSAIERIWQRNEGVAYVVSPVGIDYADVLAT
ncbi:MAG: C39 family peptidase [Candidatus Eremiobacteraeota bacterium]|nr:C39 family peptidase [Candidatus Eremiobacteraeota bacterium]MBV8284189.1 C39 family peptidase [Candidatus Eremiobacteraeota bacterium]MBV8655953.1 C39 family peptidase [Candidatus Eremiobacteraeota bacterium]